MAKNASCAPMCGANFCYCRERSADEPDTAFKPPTIASSAVVSKRLDAVAIRLFSGVMAAFFASLERCSCINIATKDDFDDGGGQPLIHDDIICPATDVACTDERKEAEDHTVEDNEAVSSK